MSARLFLSVPCLSYQGAIQEGLVRVARAGLPLHVALYGFVSWFHSALNVADPIFSSMDLAMMSLRFHPRQSFYMP